MSAETLSMRRARRWLAEMRAAAATYGGALDAETEALFGHMVTCRTCELREHSDPEFCEAANEILDGLADAEERAFAAAIGVERVELPEEVVSP